MRICASRRRSTLKPVLEDPRADYLANSAAQAGASLPEAKRLIEIIGVARLRSVDLDGRRLAYIVEHLNGQTVSLWHCGQCANLTLIDEGEHSFSVALQQMNGEHYCCGSCGSSDVTYITGSSLDDSRGAA